MDPTQNPFTPGPGAQPPELAGRDALLERAHLALEQVRHGRPARSFAATGQRGVGKSVLLTRMRVMAEASGVKVGLVAADENETLADLLIAALRRIMIELDSLGAPSDPVQQGLRTLKSFMAARKLKSDGVGLVLDVLPEQGSADKGNIEADLPDLFASLGRAAAARKAGIALLIDDLHMLHEYDMNALILSLRRVADDGLPILVIAAGLPQVTGLPGGGAKSDAKRVFDFVAVGALGAEDARRAVVKPARRFDVTFDSEALEDIVAVTRGYPIILQEFAYQAWNVAEHSPITRDDVSRARPFAIARLDESFFPLGLYNVTIQERDYLRAMASLGPGPHNADNVADRMAADMPKVSGLRRSLIAKGMVYTPAYGITAFCVPLFDQYMRRIMPNWQPSPRPPRKV